MRRGIRTPLDFAPRKLGAPDAWDSKSVASVRAAEWKRVSESICTTVAYLRTTEKAHSQHYRPHRVSGVSPAGNNFLYRH